MKEKKLKAFFVMLVTLFVSCSDHQQIESMADVKDVKLVEKSDANAKINALIEKARWGDGQAYLQLADCYKDGIGVQKDFLGMMSMVAQARAHGAINNENDYLMRIPDDNDFKRCFDLMDKSGSELREGKDTIMAQLAAMDNPDALALYGIVSIENGDTTGGFETIRRAADNGSNFAALLNTLPDWKGEIRPDKAKLEQIAERIPIAYKLLGELCLDPDENGNIDEMQAACYFLKADKHALLSKREARWLLDYYRDGGIVQLNDEDVRRLETFICFPDEEEEVVVVDSVSVDNIIKVTMRRKENEPTEQREDR